MPKGVLITDEQREEVQDLVAADKTVPQIARKMHLSTTTVSRIKNGQPTGKGGNKARTYPVLMHLTMDEIHMLIDKVGPSMLHKFKRPL